jgi:hypothetical protein
VEKFNSAMLIFDEAKGGIEKIVGMANKFGDAFSSFKNMSLISFDFHIAVSKKRISFSSAHWVENYKFLEKKDGSEFTPKRHGSSSMARSQMQGSLR